jgi:hypothetical protein
MGGDPSELCVSRAPGDHVLVGEFLTVRPDTEVTIQSVELVDPAGLELEDAWLLPRGENIGTAEYPLAGPRWEGRHDVHGAVATAGYNNIIMLLRRDGDEHGVASSVDIHYTYDGAPYTAHGTMKITLETVCS